MCHCVQARVLDIAKCASDSRIRLLRQENVVRWILGDLSFLAVSGEPPNKSKRAAEYKKKEDEWGRLVAGTRRPDLVMKGQWTNVFGEYLCEELCVLCGARDVTRPSRKEHFCPDLEIHDAIIEVKTGTYNTSGTASEKILGCPFKYADVPILYGKPLFIVCIGGAERICRENYGNLAGTAMCTPQKRKFLDFFRECGIRYIGATDVLRALISH